MTHFSFKEKWAKELTFPPQKGKPKNFAPNTPLYLGEAFEIPKDFSRKVLCVRVWGGQPQLITHTKKHGNAVFFILGHYMLELRSKPCFKELFVKSPLKIRKNFPANIPIYFGKSF